MALARYFEPQRSPCAHVKAVDSLRRWALTVQARSNHNKATCALANELARIRYATLRDAEPYGVPRRHKVSRTAFALP